MFFLGIIYLIIYNYLTIGYMVTSKREV